jgi:hypothetical protein
MDVYRAMGYPEQQLEIMEKMEFFSSPQILVVSVVSFVPFIGYLLFIRKYFRQEQRPPTLAAAPA